MSKVNCFYCFLNEETPRPELKHQRPTSGNVSPTYSSCKMLRRTKTRKNSIAMAKKPKKSKKSKKSKTVKQKERLTLSIKSLRGREIYRGPKLYENQFFRDVYDKYGNHDRVFDLSTEKETPEKKSSEVQAPCNSLADQSTHETKPSAQKINKKLNKALQEVPQ